MSFCFEDGAKAVRSGTISEEEYLSLILDHFLEVRHVDDSKERNVKFDLSGSKPYAESIRYAALDTEYEPLKDTSLIEKLFQACLAGQTDEFKSHLDDVTKEAGVKALILQPLATLAAEKGHPAILKDCITRGAQFNQHLDRAIEIGFYKHPHMLQVLTATKWRNIQDIKITKDDPDAIDTVVRPWLQKKAPEVVYLEERETHKERHERLMRTGNHPPGTCMTGAELEERFGWIAW